ncbi:MAG: serine hydrolase [Propionibacteriaceae bacterium]
MTPSPLDLASALFSLPGVTWSVMVRDAATGGVLASHQPDLELRTASVGKLFLLVELARQLDEGLVDPNERLTWQPDEWLADSGLWYLLDQRQLSVLDLAVLVGAFSDNLATNVLVRRLGIEAVQGTSYQLGFRRSRLLDRVRTERGPSDPPTLSVGSADELSDLMSRLYEGVLISPSVSERVLSWLATNADLSMVAAAFDLDPLAHGEADRGLKLANKTGTISTARIDVGVVSGRDGAVAYAVLANWAPDADPRDEVLDMMRDMGRAIRRFVS